MNVRLLIPTVAVAALALAACGKQGELDRPAPLFGAKAKSDYARERQAAARANGQGTPDSAATSQTNGDYSQGSDGGSKDPALQPLRTSPPPGAPPNPFSGRSGGVLPDPYANPNTAPR